MINLGGQRYNNTPLSNEIVHNSLSNNSKNFTFAGIELNTMQKIKKGDVVGFSFILTNKSGEILDQSYPGEPLMYIHGAVMIVPGLEKNLLDLQVGDKKIVEVEPEEAYGLFDESLLFQVPRQNFPAEAELSEGMQFQSQDEGGLMNIVVKEIKGDTIYVDANHPLAGETLKFDVTIESIREATAQEIEHNHVHQHGSDH